MTDPVKPSAVADLKRPAHSTHFKMGAITDTGATNAYTDERIKIARTFGASKLLHSIWQFLSTAIALVVLWLTMRFTLDFGYWLTLALAIPADRRLETSSDK